MTESHPIKVLVCGGRDFNDGKLVFKTLDEIHAQRPIGLLIEGGAKGADERAHNWALARGVQPCQMKPCWGFYNEQYPGRKNPAGPIRNSAMLYWLQPDLVVAFPGGPGTADMVRISRNANIEVLEVKE